MDDDKIIVYHGGSQEIKQPNFDHSRLDIDFGRGFYLTRSDYLAKKWACRRSQSVLNTYKLNCEGLSIKKFSLDEEWLEYVCDNRSLRPNHRYDDYDVLIGPIADDKLFSAIELYESGFISAENAVKVMTAVDYGTQLTIKTQQGLKALNFVGSKVLSKAERSHFFEQYQRDKESSRIKTEQILRSINR